MDMAPPGFKVTDPAPKCKKPRAMLDEKMEIGENRPMVIVESTDEFYDLVHEGRPLLACFHAQWCGDCHYLKPAYPELEARFGDQVEFVQVDIDEMPDVARGHEVSGIPSFILFSSSREIFRLVNPRRKTKEEVTDFLEKGLALVPRSKEFS